MVAGRAFDTGDADESRGVAIVSETFARRFFGGRDPIGARIRPHFPGGDAYWFPLSTNQPMRIVGVARDVREKGIKDDDDPPQMYLPYAQTPSRVMYLMVRTQGSPLDWAPAVRRAIGEVDRDVPVFDVRTLEEITEQSFSRQSAFGDMLGAAAGLALLLAATGIYALLAWSVSRRTRDIGIRIAHRLQTAVLSRASSCARRYSRRCSASPPVLLALWRAAAGDPTGAGGRSRPLRRTRLRAAGGDSNAGRHRGQSCAADARGIRVDPVNALRMD